MGKVTPGGIRVTYKRTASGWDAIGACPFGTQHSASGGTKRVAVTGLDKHVASCNCSGCSEATVIIAAEMADLASASAPAFQS